MNYLMTVLHTVYMQVNTLQGCNRYRTHSLWAAGQTEQAKCTEHCTYLSWTAAIRLIYCNTPSHDFHYSAQINVTIRADNVNFATGLVLKLQIFNLQYLFSYMSIFHFKQHHNSSKPTTASFTNSLRFTEDTAHSWFVVFIKGPLICKDNLIFSNLLLMAKKIPGRD